MPYDDNPALLLPASRRTQDDDLIAPNLSAVSSRPGNPDGALISAEVYQFVDYELDIDRLDHIYDWLWIAGRPMPPRPLHQQRLLEREISITERLDLHLVWTTGRIFIKPLPKFLLEPTFWDKFLCGHATQNSHCSHGRRPTVDHRKRALGFFFSYTALIAHESDFHIAKDLRLIPEELQWPAWKEAVRELLVKPSIYPQVHRRFHYGELRLSRLNKIYFLWVTPLRGYRTKWNQYGLFFRDNFSLLASSTIYIAIVLTAMQVGLATESLQKNSIFSSASYGFAVFSILGPLVFGGLLIVIFCCIFIDNWRATWRYSKKRLKKLSEA